MKLQRDLREFIELLNSAKVKYLIVGGYAVGFHGHPRQTGDIDFLIEPSPSNAERVEAVLRSFGFASLGLKADAITRPGAIIQLGRPPYRIDWLASITGVSFEQTWQSRVEATLDGLPVAFLSKEHLLMNKKAVRRAKDLADIEQLGGPPDTA